MEREPALGARDRSGIAQARAGVRFLPQERESTKGLAPSALPASLRKLRRLLHLAQVQESGENLARTRLYKYPPVLPFRFPIWNVFE